MKSSIILLLAFAAFVFSQTPDQFRVARDVFRAVAATIDDYLVANPLHTSLEERLQSAFKILFSVSSNVTTAMACSGIYQTAWYVCNIENNTRGLPPSTVPTVSTIPIAPTAPIVPAPPSAPTAVRFKFPQ